MLTDSAQCEGQRIFLPADTAKDVRHGEAVEPVLSLEPQRLKYLGSLHN